MKNIPRIHSKLSKTMLISKETLTIDKCSTLSDDELDLLFLEDGEFDNESLAMEDYQTWTVEILGKIYNVIHGFPGDNPIGLFYKNDHAYYQFGEALSNNYNDKVFTNFLKWYTEISKDLTDYEFIQKM